MPRAKKPPVVPYNTGNNEKVPDAPPGRAYGARKATEESIDAAPLAQGGGTVTPISADPATMLAAAQGYNPQGPGLTDPSENPNEPVTTGLATGPGEGPASLNLPPAPDQAATTANFLRTIYTMVPAAQNNDFLRVLELAEQDQWQ